MQTKITCWLWAFSLSFGLAAKAETYTYQSQIAHPIVNYKMTARLDPQTKKVTGQYVLTWWNHTEDTIPDLYFHLYLNAFKNVNSSFLRGATASEWTHFVEDWLANPDKNKWGWEDVNKIQIVGGADLTSRITFVHPDDNNALDQTVIRIVLPQPIPPHGTIQLSVDFTSKLPLALARSGYEGNYFLVAQWFPKIGVYEGAGERGREQGGWNCHQYHSNTEFYADYGVYDVDLTVPSSYILGASGVRRSKRRNSDETTTYDYYQQDIHDFAWTASPNFLKVTKTFDWKKEVSQKEIDRWAKVFNLPPHQLDLRNVDVNFLLQPGHVNLTRRYFRAIFNGLKYFGLWYGKYPYDTLTVVDTPRHSATCCMEYPTFITVGSTFLPGRHNLSLEGVTVHEFGHQYWYGMVGSNEFEESWLDEGFNTYSTGKVLQTAYGPACGTRYFLGLPVEVLPWLSIKLPSFPFAGMGSLPMGAFFSCVQVSEHTSWRRDYLPHAKDDNLVRNGWQYLNGASYVVNSYDRVGLTMDTLENYLGKNTMARVMRAYFDRWRFRHPSTQDFIDVVNEVSGRDMNWFFQQFFYNSDTTDYAVTRIKTSPLLGNVGVYEENGKKRIYSEESAEEKFEKSKKKQYRSIVVVRRLGEVEAPLDVLVRFDDGKAVHEHWNGQYRWVKYVFQGLSKVKFAEVDPEHKLVLDTNYTNNSRLRTTNPQGALRWYIRWIFWLENMFFGASFFG